MPSAAFRQDACKHRHVFSDRASLGEQRIGGDDGGDGRKKRKQAVEDDARGDRQQPVFTELLVRSDQDVLPALPGNLPRRDGVPAAPCIVRGGPARPWFRRPFRDSSHGSCRAFPRLFDNARQALTFLGQAGGGRWRSGRRWPGRGGAPGSGAQYHGTGGGRFDEVARDAGRRAGDGGSRRRADDPPPASQVAESVSGMSVR